MKIPAHSRVSPELRSSMRYARRLSTYFKLDDWSISKLDEINQRIESGKPVWLQFWQLKIVGWYSDWLHQKLFEERK